MDISSSTENEEIVEYFVYIFRDGPSWQIKNVSLSWRAYLAWFRYLAYLTYSFFKILYYNLYLVSNSNYEPIRRAPR